MTAAGLFWAVGCAAATPPAPVACATCYVPAVATSFEVNLDDSNSVNVRLNARLFDLDWQTSPNVVARLKARGGKVFCYISVGSWENYRPDKASFPRSVLGSAYGGYPNERWLDVRRIDILEPIMVARMERCKRSGFDGVWFDNVDGFTMHPGFSITSDQQLAYNATLANDAHSRGLSAAFNNDPQQTQQMVPYFDWVLYETDRDDVGPCFYSPKPCRSLQGFREAGKATFILEYRESKVPTGTFCRTARRRGFNGLVKREALGNYRISCRLPS